MSVLGIVNQTDNGYDNFLVGKVVDNNDPLKLQRVRVVIPKLFSEDVDVSLLPWVGPKHKSPFGSGDNYGVVHVPVIGSRVAIHLQGDRAEYALHETDIITPSFALPEELDTNYPNRIGAKTPTGDVYYYETTSGQFYFRHNKGTSIRIDADGNMFVSVNGNYTEYVKGDFTRVVDGAYNDTVKGKVTQNYGATTLAVNGSYNVTVSSDFSEITSGSKTTSASSWTNAGVLTSSDDIIAVATSVQNHVHPYDDAGNPNITQPPNT